MASSYSSDLKLELMVTGEKSGTWGDITNTNLNILQQAIAGYEEVSIAGGAQTTALTFSNGVTSNGKNAVIKFTGTITGNQIVTIPDGIEKVYVIENGTTITPASHWTRRGHRGCEQCRATFAGGLAGSAKAGWLVHLSGADRRRQD